MPPDDETPTARSSGTVAIFERTVEEAIDRLSHLPPCEENVDLRREAVALRSLFRSWSVKVPKLEDRSQAIARLMDLHRAVEEFASSKK